MNAWQPTDLNAAYAAHMELADSDRVEQGGGLVSVDLRTRLARMTLDNTLPFDTRQAVRRAVATGDMPPVAATASEAEILVALRSREADR